MSALLEEAIVDAKALKEAALKNAENLIIEKYSLEVKKAMDTLLEQEEPNEKQETEISKIAKQLPDAFSSTDDDDVIINLDELDSYINESLSLEEKIAGEAKKVIKGAHAMNAQVQAELEVPEEVDEMGTMMAEIDELYAMDEAEAQLEEPALVLDPDQTTGNADGDEGLSDEDMRAAEQVLQALSAATAAAVDSPTQSTTPSFGNMSSAPPPEPPAPIHEKVRVNAEPVPSGWNDTPESTMEKYEDLALAILQDTEIVEELENVALLKKRLTKENKTLKESAKKILEENKKLQEVVKYLREKIEDVNISNAKLLYINQTLESVSLNERQKEHIVEAITRADSVKEAKVIYETLQNSVGSVQKHKLPESLSESVTNKSSMLLAARHKNKKNEASSPFFDRMQKLAGLKT